MQQLKHLVMTTLMLLSFITASAYDFMVDGLAYNVVSISDLTCEVVKSDTKYSGDIVIPSTVTYQGRTLTVIKIWVDEKNKDGAFYGCSSLTSVEIPHSVTTIGNYAFYGCSALTSIKIPNSVTTIGESAFNGCSSLISIEIPNSATTIGSFAFSGCSSLTSVEIPHSVTTIGNHAFYGCSSLTSVEIPHSVTTIGNYAFYGCSSLISIEIPNSATTIGRFAFSGCSALTSIKIPNSVTTIGESAFNGCSSLISIEIPNSVTTIGESAFNGCSSLISIEIPNSVTTIGYRAFGHCSSLTSVEIPGSVTTIGKDAFAGCPLKSLIWESGINICFKKADDPRKSFSFESAYLEYLEILPSVSEPIAIVSGGESAHLDSLKKLSLGRSLPYVIYEHHYSEFGCPNLTELELTGYVNYFYITGRFIKNLTIDNGVELDAGEYGADMSKYDKLECITMKGNVPQFIPTFANVTYLNAKLRVPKGTLRAYQNAEGWKNFWNIEEHEEEVGIDEVPVEVGAKTECGRYDLQGRPVDDTYRGVTIIRYTDGSAKKVVTTR